MPRGRPKKIPSKAKWFHNTAKPDKMGQNAEITPEMRQLLLATLLGDGSLSIQRNYRNARFQMRHSIRQRHWFFCKTKKLISLCSAKAVHVQASDGYSRLSKLHMQTLVHPELTKIHDMTHVNSVKTVNRRWLEELNEYGLMTFYLDDGGLTGEGNRKIKLSVQGFGEEGVKIISDFLAQKWGLSNQIEYVTNQSTDKIYATIILYQECTKKFLRLFMKLLPTERMLYKFCLKYRDAREQQRWISELKLALPQYKKAIDRFYKNL